MPKWLKVTLFVLGGFMLLGIAAVAAIAYWVVKNKDEFMAMGERAKAEAKSFASGSDANGCIREALSRLDTKPGLMEQAEHKVFLSECLRAAPRPAGFCDAVPTRTDILESVQYGLEACAQHQRAGDQACGRLFGAVQEACHGR